MNTLLESVIAILSMVAANWLLTKNEFEGKTKSILSVVAGLAVWVLLPYAFDDVSAVEVAEDANEKQREAAMLLDKVAEGGWDHLTFFLRLVLSVIVLVVVLIAMSMS